jgi:hypothetical protein
MTARPPNDDTRSPRKIPRTEWGAIAARHDAGESLAKIGRDYKCTAPAIRYILHRRIRAAGGLDDMSDLAPAPSRRGDTTTEYESPAQETIAESRQTVTLAPGSDRAPVANDTETSGFDATLRDRVTVEVSVFLVAFETVMAKPTTKDFDCLRDATDRLLRAAARVRIELERVSPLCDRIGTFGSVDSRQWLDTDQYTRRA